VTPATPEARPRKRRAAMAVRARQLSSAQRLSSLARLVHFIPYRREGGATTAPKVPIARGKTMMVMAENIKAPAGEDHNRFFACVILSV